MTRSEVVKLVREVLQELQEANVTGGTATFTPGAGETYATPFAFGKGTRAKKSLKKLGYKQVSRPKRPSHTKGFDYL
tara:strand:+ start:775 stop:1005 length:231 start_codon:yes stop_codon:yes gene_type:complete